MYYPSSPVSPHQTEVRERACAESPDATLASGHHRLARRQTGARCHGRCRVACQWLLRTMDQLVDGRHVNLNGHSERLAWRAANRLLKYRFAGCLEAVSMGGLPLTAVARAASRASYDVGNFLRTPPRRYFSNLLMSAFRCYCRPDDHVWPVAARPRANVQVAHSRREIALCSDAANQLIAARLAAARLSLHIPLLISACIAVRRWPSGRL